MTRAGRGVAAVDFLTVFRESPRPDQPRMVLGQIGVLPQALFNFLLLLGCLGLVAVLAIALERRITPEVNGIEPGVSPPPAR